MTEEFHDIFPHYKAPTPNIPRTDEGSKKARKRSFLAQNSYLKCSFPRGSFSIEAIMTMIKCSRWLTRTECKIQSENWTRPFYVNFIIKSDSFFDVFLRRSSENILASRALLVVSYSHSNKMKNIFQKDNKEEFFITRPALRDWNLTLNPQFRVVFDDNPPSCFSNSPYYSASVAATANNRGPIVSNCVERTKFSVIRFSVGFIFIYQIAFQR